MSRIACARGLGFDARQRHPGGANYGLADGSVRFYPSSMDPSVFSLLGSMAGGVAIKPDE
jgi:prepilin-type processing-associated H-X9-DG protein